MPAASNDASRYLAGNFALDVIGKGRSSHSLESVTFSLSLPAVSKNKLKEYVT